MKQIEKPITLKLLKQMAENRFGNLVKAVVDLDKEIMVVDAEMHADEEQFLLANGSKQKDLWGINLYPEEFGRAEFVEFDSMINLRPVQKNFSRGVEDENIRQKIIRVVGQWVKE